MREEANLPLKPLDVLKKYWGYDKFRTLQEDIINNALKRQNTLALLPTGGGKSICFQIPGLIFQGVCIVVSPLIALMKDQVEQLKQRNINAVSLTSGMHRNEIDIALDNCVYGKTKFLYVSPERLKSDLFIARLKLMKIGLLVVDEAHCISQWGYDFRLAYLDISEIREYIDPGVPVLALTASATPKIQKDILDKLQITDAQVFKKSFARSNLSYKCLITSDKVSAIYDRVIKTEGSVIIYVRSRKKTAQYSDQLNKKGLKSAFYHAGLSTQNRDRIQNDWIKNKFQVIVATNAFGMGIDKPDVRMVFHIDLPDSLEAYYQEAGRAGRDEQFAEAIILYTERDIEELRSKTQARFPDLEMLRQTYTALCNNFQLALASGEMQSFPLNLPDVSKKFNIPVLSLYYSIKELEKHGFVQFEEHSSNYSTLNICLDHKELYRLQVAQPKFDSFLKSVLRIYGAELFSAYLRINEDEIASKASITHNQVIDNLITLTKNKVLDYIPKSDLPKLTFVLPRQNTHQAFIGQNLLDMDRERYFERMEKIISFVKSKKSCRTNLIQDYFGENELEECGICDNCLNKVDVSNHEKLKNSIYKCIIAHKALNFKHLNSLFLNIDPKIQADIIRQLSEEGHVIVKANRDIISL